MFESNNFNSNYPSQHRDFVMKLVSKFFEVWGQGLDGTVTLKCENGKARFELSLDLGCQEKGRDGNSVSSPTRQFYDTPRRSRSSPSKLRRSRARAEAYQLKKSLFQIKDKKCVASSKEKVFASEVDPVARLR